MALLEPLPSQIAKIKVIGVGGAGMNAVNHMLAENPPEGVEFVVVNTDAQVLLASPAQIKIQIGEKLTRGLGAGGNPQIGAKAAEESKDKIKQLLEGSDMVFITAGAGGGTGTGAAPIIARLAKEDLKILTVGVVTKPFHFEGTKRMVIAEEGIKQLKEATDALITIPNQRLLDIKDKITFLNAFKMADAVLARAVEGIAEIITIPGLINVDFADIKAIMRNAGSALLGVGVGEGEERGQQALQEALESPLLGTSIRGARGVLFNVVGGEDLKMEEIHWLAEQLSQQVGGDANIIFGARIDKEFKGRLRLTLIATGFEEQAVLQRLIQDSQKKEPAEKTSEITSSEKKKNKKPPKANKTAEMLKKLASENADLGVHLEDAFDIPAFLRRG